MRASWAWRGGCSANLPALEDEDRIPVMTDTIYGKYFFIACLAVAVYFVYRILDPFLSAVIWAAILATASYPLYRRLVRKIRRPCLGSLITCFLLTVVIVVPILLLTILLADQSVDAYHAIEEKVRSGEVTRWEKSVRQSSPYLWVRRRLPRLRIDEPDVQDVVLRAASGASRFLVDRSKTLFSGFAQSIFKFFVMLLSLYYFLVDGPGMVHKLRELSPLPVEHEDRVLGKFREMVDATLRGSFLTALLQGAAGGLVFLFFGLPSPLLWGSVMALVSLVPLVGTSLVWGPVVIFYVMTGAWFKVILLALICGGIVGSIDNFVKPFLIKGRSELHTLWVFFGVLGGIGVFGFLGIVLGPLVVALLLTLIEIYKIEFRNLLTSKATP